MSAPHIGTDAVVSVIESLDFDPPCDYSGHKGEGTAAWAVWRSVGCEHITKRFSYYCDPCWQGRLRSRRLHCPARIHFFEPMENVVRIERIR